MIPIPEKNITRKLQIINMYGHKNYQQYISKPSEGINRKDHTS